MKIIFISILVICEFTISSVFAVEGEGTVINGNPGRVCSAKEGGSCNQPTFIQLPDGYKGTISIDSGLEEKHNNYSYQNAAFLNAGNICEVATSTFCPLGQHKQTKFFHGPNNISPGGYFDLMCHLNSAGEIYCGCGEYEYFNVCRPCPSGTHNPYRTHRLVKCLPIGVQLQNTIIFKIVDNKTEGNISASTCVSVDSRKGWQEFNLSRSYDKIIHISGGWSVDARSYSPVGAFGHIGQDATNLSPYNQYKYDQRFPFGALLININQELFWIQNPVSLNNVFDFLYMRINDADNVLGDNGGSLKVCFGFR